MSPQSASRHRCARALASLLSLVLLSTPAAWAQSKKTTVDKPSPPKVTLNFVNAEIEGIARAIGAILEKPILIDPRVRGTMTLTTDKPVTAQEAYTNFLGALRGLGHTAVDVNGLIKVVPEADAKLQSGPVLVDESPSKRGDQVLTKIFKIEHESALTLIPILRPLISPNNTINANTNNNSLVITDYADNLSRLGAIISALDVAPSSDLVVIPIQHVLAAELGPVVQKILDAQATTPIAGLPAQSGQNSGNIPANSLSVLADPRSNSLLIKSTKAARLAQARSLIAQLDRPGSNGVGGSGIHVLYLKNADAVRLAQVLRAAFVQGGSSNSASSSGARETVSPAGVTTSSGSGVGSTSSIGAAGSFAGSANSASPQSSQPVQSLASPSTGGFIQADPASNALIITAPEPLFREIRAVVERLDVRRAQVMVETMLVEISASKAAEVGFQLQGLLGGSNKIGLIGGTNFGEGGNNILQLSIAAATGSVNAAGSIAAPSEGLNLGLLKRYGDVITLGALARFLQTEADGNILSTPNLVTLDNEEAKIVVGQNVPFVTGSFTNSVNGANNPFQTIDRRDVGITLRVRPQIGENGSIKLVIYQESSSVVNQRVASGAADATAGIVTNKRSIESTVVVNDGDILVMGGLIQEQFQDNRSKIPGLGDIPGIGALFRSDNRSKVKNNLMIFLRPVVMKDSSHATSLSADRYDEIRARQLESNPAKRIGLDIGNPIGVLPEREKSAEETSHGEPATSPTAPDSTSRP